MRKIVVAALLVAPFLGGCEIFDETYTIASAGVFHEGGVEVVEYVEEDFGGTRWVQYRATNNNDGARCVRVSIASGRTNGHSMGRVIRVPGYSTEDIGYVYLPADFTLRTQVWGTDYDDACGPPPS